jgi:hypothetical protein
MIQDKKKNKKTIFGCLITIPILLTLGYWGLNKVAFYGNGRKAYEALATSNVTTIIKYQKEYNFKNNQFAKDSLKKIETVSDSPHQFSVEVDENKVTIFAKLKSKIPSNPEEFIKSVIYPDIVSDARSFVAGIFLIPANSKSPAILKDIF